MKKNKGFTFVEVLISAVLVFILAYGSMSMVSFSMDFYRKIHVRRAQERSVLSLINDMNADISRFSINMSADANISDLYADVDTYPLYWSSKTNLVNKERCLELHPNASLCPLEGRMTYLLQPIAEVPGMYKASIAVYHPLLMASKTQPKIITSMIKVR
jgi:Tfp pilus assembly protein PilE